MDKIKLAQAIERLVGRELAEQLMSDFAKLRQDVHAGTLEQTSAGKFVESFVDCLVQISGEHVSNSTGVDRYLNDVVVHKEAVPEGLRVCGSRVARAIYTLRNRRNIVHKNDIDPNKVDLEFTYHAAAWIVAELIRAASDKTTMEEAQRLIDIVMAPVYPLVDEFDDELTVQANVTARVQVLILLHRKYPEPAYLQQLYTWTKCLPSTVRSTLHKMGNDSLVIGNSRKGYRLTSRGYTVAVGKIVEIQETGV